MKYKGCFASDPVFREDVPSDIMNHFLTERFVGVFRGVDMIIVHKGVLGRFNGNVQRDGVPGSRRSWWLLLLPLAIG
jgi:hypothetical protein